MHTVLKETKVASFVVGAEQSLLGWSTTVRTWAFYITPLHGEAPFPHI